MDRVWCLHMVLEQWPGQAGAHISVSRMDTRRAVLSPLAVVYGGARPPPGAVPSPCPGPAVPLECASLLRVEGVGIASPQSQLERCWSHTYNTVNAEQILKDPHSCVALDSLSSLWLCREISGISTLFRPVLEKLGFWASGGLPDRPSLSS